MSKAGCSGYTAARWLCKLLIPAYRSCGMNDLKVLAEQTGGAVFSALAGVKLSTTNMRNRSDRQCKSKLRRITPLSGETDG
ncbi:hypothetical protein GF249_11900 [Salmonella enterica subsp. enterica]|nr:hypothetical protein [Salmonella enterica subsp. enterica serovar Brandenburg]EBG6926372.1 hypothetical protein [Salmonella enterica subsp. enterica]ECN6007720.1 hypothetical protein [Salmonella enterica subsp. enterica serovar Brandenburg]EDK1374869.1 hypothetical protein [Salmonella enterica subsp. enterica serovar Baildon]